MNGLFESKDFSISYNIYGEGMPVVLLHGFGEDASIFKLQVDALKTSCKLIIPNITGTGNSALLFNQVDPSMELLANYFKEFIDRLQIDKFVLLGHSMGGYITLAFAEKYPDNLLAFGLIHSTAFADNDDKKANRWRGIELMSKYGADAFLRTTFPNLFSNDFKATNQDELQSLIQQFSYITTNACVFYYKAMIARTDKTDLLKHTNLPVLFVIGEEDIAAPMSDVLQQVPLPALSSVHILNNVGHMSMIEAPEKLNEILKAFFKVVAENK